MQHVEVRPGVYRDSVHLLQLSRTLADLPGVRRAQVAMATGLNLELLATMGFPAPDRAGPNDLVVALEADDAGALTAAQDRLAADLAGPGGAAASEAGAAMWVAATVRPRTVGTAVRAFGANLALVSTPGRYAFAEAMDALEAGASVMVFSNNVPLAQEVALKRTAARRRRLVMGPDCGTASISGVGLGFANVVRPGPVGLVAASGTGAQQVMSLLALADVGISHCLGVGGRDLAAAVGGLSTHPALDALDADPATELVVLVGKPPAAAVEEAIRAHADRLATPVILATVGTGQPDLTAAVERALLRLGRPVPTAWPRWLPADGAVGGGARGAGGPSGPGWLRGWFSGGTLCQEAMAITGAGLGGVWSNVGPNPDSVAAGHQPDGHTMTDLGADELTLGRPHPMIDLGPRLERIAADAADPRCRVLLFDVVLGHGAHADPAGELAPAIRAALAGRPSGDLAVVVSLIGTAGDPQDLGRQAVALREAGAAVFASNAAATRQAVALARGRAA